jgi:hypothetical protein
LKVGHVEAGIQCFSVALGTAFSSSDVPAAIGCVPWRTSKAVAQRLLALDIYYEADGDASPLRHNKA